MVQALTRIAFQEGKVYKVILETKEKLIPIYEKVNNIGKILLFLR